ncbi:MAG: hypothetical protein NUW01_13015 [Gemmatimonadaceae bacterium]|nr:hypothetical protein [Gemmatimonadaceae bacterium]
MSAWVNPEHTYLVSVVGMPPRVAGAVAVMRDMWPLSDGPAHIVIADWNLSDGTLGACLTSIERGETYSDYPPGHPIFAATSAVLQWLLDNVPEGERENWERYPLTIQESSGPR